VEGANFLIEIILRGVLVLKDLAGESQGVIPGSHYQLTSMQIAIFILISISERNLEFLIGPSVFSTAPIIQVYIIRVYVK